MNRNREGLTPNQIKAAVTALAFIVNQVVVVDTGVRINATVLSAERVLAYVVKSAQTYETRYTLELPGGEKMIHQSGGPAVSPGEKVVCRQLKSLIMFPGEGGFIGTKRYDCAVAKDDQE